MRARADILAALVLAVFALIGIFWAVPRETVEGDPGEIAPAVVPVVALWVIFACAIWQGATSLANRARASGEFDRFSLGFLVISAAVLMAALGAIWGFGYIAGGVLCILAIGAAMRPKGTIWLWLVVVAVGLPLATFYLTWHGLRLSLP